MFCHSKCVTPCGGLFVLLGFDPSYCTTARGPEVRQLGLAYMGLHFRPACAQVEPSQYRRVLAEASRAECVTWPQQEQLLQIL